MRKIHGILALGILLVATFGYVGIAQAADLSTSAATCTGSPNVGSSTAVVQTGGPVNASFGHVFDVRATVFNRTVHCHYFQATIVYGGGSWEFPNESSPRKTTATWFGTTEPTPGYYYTYTTQWKGWIKPNSHVNFYETMEVAEGANKGETGIIEIYLGNPNKGNTPRSSWAIDIQ